MPLHQRTAPAARSRPTGQGRWGRAVAVLAAAGVLAATLTASPASPVAPASAPTPGAYPADVLAAPVGGRGALLHGGGTGEGAHTEASDGTSLPSDHRVIDAATGQVYDGEELAVGQQALGGYQMLPYATASRTDRVVRFAPGTPASTRAHMAAAVDEVNAVAGIGLRVGPDSTTPYVTGEILVRVVGTTSCGTGTTGCASSLSTVDGNGNRYITSTLIDIRSDVVGTSTEPGTVRHELGHALGLAHYDSLWDGQYQVMRARAGAGRDIYRSGDRNGLVALAGAFTNRNVTGSIDRVVESLGRLYVSGWALDRDTPSQSIATILFIDGTLYGLAMANQPRPDVAAANPGATAAGGYTMSAPVTTGPKQVCVSAVGHKNQVVGVGCRGALVTGSPTGGIEVARPWGPGGRVRVAGWALDPDTVDPQQVTVTVDGAVAATVTAGQVRSDIAAAHPGQTPDKGFDVTVSGLAPGPRNVCVTATGVPPGPSTRAIGCRTVQVPGPNPVGGIDVAQGALGRVRVAGWALDPDVDTPANVHVYVNGQFAGSAAANRVRSDVARAWPGYGNLRGYDTEVAATSGGRADVCVFAVNVGPGTANTLLGCRSVTLPGGNPFGSLDVVRRSDGRLIAAGWTIDPDTVAPTALHVYVNGRFAGVAATGGWRTDVQRAWPAYGPWRGFETRVPAPAAPAAPADVCVFAINVGAGNANTLLGCRRA